jgi:hypothetical protein
MFSSPFWFSNPYESTIEAPRNIYLAADVVVEVAATETALFHRRSEVPTMLNISQLITDYRGRHILLAR